ncbi:hypothetical protein JI435_422570 [Parastagonospora nodorum SN15]|uniref:Uncharacterized protein n=1 Tax=Phaeosphaeria nodorum (strain SN15 / ATCC MYA-4574 / FGSC 10173) TaxID=321614 RepID=A0A7U2NPD5_PHANO|nr:hypothetical protein JI435_422570 [Parastagonospora nodorum SN15]
MSPSIVTSLVSSIGRA